MDVSTEALEAALLMDDPSESIRRVKAIAAQSFADADSEAQVVPTQNFNHTYLPDFVLEWNSGVRRDKRYVYLRASSRAEELEEDVLTLAGREPIFVHLSDLEHTSTSQHPNESPDQTRDLERAAVNTRTLVTSLPAIGRFHSPEATQTGQIVSTYVVRGGQGLLEDSDAERASERIERGFNGALESDRDSTADAIAAAAEILDVPSSAEFTHLLEAAWISGGAAAADFPGSMRSLGDSIPPALLRQLLEIVPESATDFWTKVGSAIDLESLAGMHLVGAQPRLQLMMTLALPRLKAKRCAIRQTERIDQTVDPFIWQVEEGILSLRGGGHQAWVFNRPAEEYAAAGPATSAPTITKLATRSQAAQIPVVQIEASNGNRTLRYASASNSDISTDNALGEISATLGSSATVNEAIALVGGHKPVRIDFDRGLAAPRTNAVYRIPDLVESTWLLMADVSEETREGLGVAVGPHRETVESDPEVLAPNQPHTIAPPAETGLPLAIERPRSDEGEK